MGYVIENPNGVYSEQPDPIPEEQFTFEVRFVQCLQCVQCVHCVHYRWSVSTTLCGLPSPYMVGLSCLAVFVSGNKQIIFSFQNFPSSHKLH